MISYCDPGPEYVRNSTRLIRAWPTCMGGPKTKITRIARAAFSSELTWTMQNRSVSAGIFQLRSVRGESGTESFVVLGCVILAGVNKGHICAADLSLLPWRACN